ncbi:Shedu immune nuclease family protein [Celeribacter sp. HF31]|uniref:Shedu immune nuclease family protein n=1 Tax=Celeribacter sp. HF31 TaxID=2721558 RepID=UPI0020CA2C01|nr:Shedu immune nuclease family protein [Celeribacter sp. HF31]
MHLIDFNTRKSKVIFEYTSEFNSNAWVLSELRKSGRVRISRVFRFQKSDLIDADRLLSEEAIRDAEIDDQEVLRFRFAKSKNGYHRIAGRLLGIRNDVWLQKDAVELERKTFVAERYINIFGRIAQLKEGESPIVVGDPEEIEAAIPPELFEELLANFPNSGEMNRYALARVDAVVGEAIQPMKSAREAYERYLNRRVSIVTDRPLEQDVLFEAEIQKYLYLRNLISQWLQEEEDRSEADWQRMIAKIVLLIFPKYIAALESVPVIDVYSDPLRSTKREIDLCLVDASGALDVIEIKKPSAAAVLGRTLYRDNFVPTRELTGAVVQTEKYLFHLSKWGLKGEQKLTEKFRTDLPDGLSIRIANPKGLIIMGQTPIARRIRGRARDHQLDLEVIKRQYANMVDILTYDDLLARLDNVIASLQRRKLG